MEQAGDVRDVPGQVARYALAECGEVLDAEARRVVLDLAEQRITTIMQNATNGTSRVVVIQPGILLRTRATTQRTLTILCTQKG